MNKLVYVNGDAVKALVNKKVDYLMHCCNSKGVMGSSIALQIKNTFPDSYAKYNKFCQINNVSVESILGAVISGDKVFNIVAQSLYGREKRQVNYGALVLGFQTIIKKLKHDNILNCTIAVPYLMACDRAGGDWETVKELLEIFPNNIQIIVYKLDK